MRLASQFSLFLALAGALLLLPPAAFSSNQNNHSKYAGSYQSAISNSDKPGPSMSASLGKDGTATITQDPGKGEETLFGHWVDSGGQVTVTFDPVQGRPTPPPMTFQPRHDGLQAVTWDHAAWGKVSPPPMKKGGSNWHNKDRRGLW